MIISNFKSSTTHNRVTRCNKVKSTTALLISVSTSVWCLPILILKFRTVELQDGSSNDLALSKLVKHIQYFWKRVGCDLRSLQLKTREYVQNSLPA